MALQQRRQPFESGAVAGSRRFACGQELLVATLGKGQSRRQQQLQEEEGAAELHGKLVFFKKHRFPAYHNAYRPDARKRCGGGRRGRRNAPTCAAPGAARAPALAVARRVAAPFRAHPCLVAGSLSALGEPARRILLAVQQRARPQAADRKLGQRGPARFSRLAAGGARREAGARVSRLVAPLWRCASTATAFRIHVRFARPSQSATACRGHPAAAARPDPCRRRQRQDAGADDPHRLADLDRTGRSAGGPGGDFHQQGGQGNAGPPGGAAADQYPRHVDRHLSRPVQPLPARAPPRGRA
jgi:hypothetical protein